MRRITARNAGEKLLFHLRMLGWIKISCCGEKSFWEKTTGKGESSGVQK